MKQTLIKTVVIVVFMYFVFFVFAGYEEYLSRTYNYNIIIVLALMLIPGFLCGVILNYDVILKSVKNKKKINTVLVGTSIIIIVLAIAPYFAYSITSKFANNGILMDQLYQFILGLMAGYCFSNAFSNE